MSKGTKFDNDKPALAYLPPKAILEVGKAFTFGAKKYGSYNYANGISTIRLCSAALRHIFQYLSGITYDSESGVHHLACAVANLLMAVDSGIDERCESWKEQS